MLNVTTVMGQKYNYHYLNAISLDIYFVVGGFFYLKYFFQVIFYVFTETPYSTNIFMNSINSL